MSAGRERDQQGVKSAQTDGLGGDSMEHSTHTGHLQLRGNTSSTLSLTASSQGCKGRLNIYLVPLISNVSTAQHLPDLFTVGTTNFPTYYSVVTQKLNIFNVVSHKPSFKSVPECNFLFSGLVFEQRNKQNQTKYFYKLKQATRTKT